MKSWPCPSPLCYFQFWKAMCIHKDFFFFFFRFSTALKLMQYFLLHLLESTVAHRMLYASRIQDSSCFGEEGKNSSCVCPAESSDCLGPQSRRGTIPPFPALGDHLSLLFPSPPRDLPSPLPRRHKGRGMVGNGHHDPFRLLILLSSAPALSNH